MKSVGGCLAIILAAAALSLPSGVGAHGDEHEAVDQSSQGDSQVLSYFRYPDNRAMIYFHIVLMTVAWVFMLPSAVMLSFARSRYAAGAGLVFIGTHAAGLATGVVYNASTPDLYPNNAHHNLGWIATVVVTIQVCIGAISSLGRFIGTRSSKQRYLGAESGFMPVSTAAMAEHEHLHKHHHSSPYRLSNDSGQGTEPLSQSSRSPSTRGSHEKENSLPLHPMAPREYEDDDGDEEDLVLDELKLPRESPRPALARLFGSLYNMVPVKVWRFVMPVHNAVNRVILIFGSIVLATGIATFGRFFEGDGIFSGLAHWIKGGIFFFYGLFALGRWAGAFGDIGWAWNLRPTTTGKNANKWYPSAEFVESALIFTYGSSNIFLEHLSNWGGEWSAEDFEHISITVLFIGGGLCGMLVESSGIRRLLNTPVEVCAPLLGDEETAKHSSPPTPVISLNPLPALVVFLVGLMMSSHTQNTALGSMIHKQWGNLLAAGSLSRVLTYLLLYLRPPTSCYPSRPPTEILAAFGLIAGGLVFAASASDTVNAMVAANVDEMALYTCILGVVGVLMAWVVLLVAMKGWAVRKEMNRSM